MENAPGRKLTAAVLRFLSGNRESRPRLLLGRHGRRRRSRGANPQTPLNLPSNPSLAVPRARRARGMAEKEAGGGGGFVGVGLGGISPTVGILLMETGAGMALGSMIDGLDLLLRIFLAVWVEKRKSRTRLKRWVTRICKCCDICAICASKIILSLQLSPAPSISPNQLLWNFLECRTNVRASPRD